MELGRILSAMQLEGLEGRRPCQLSGGQTQRAALVRILCGRDRQPHLFRGSLILENPRFGSARLLGRGFKIGGLPVLDAGSA